jgi:Tol biopolymer transport system component
VALSAGNRIGAYEIAVLIGVGGMGEVYRAADTKLGRDVAIKVLPESLATDAERIARLRREARALAALNHPNIAQIHGYEDSSGIHALVMELVPGPTLADRIRQGALPVNEALSIASQIADALDAAHEQGLVHRDLKPANIKVRPDGTVKVLDFGLAKLTDPHNAAAGSNPSTELPTATSSAMTSAGVVIGTAAYMSPEQARGLPVDRRADIWAFGCVLFEMLTGRAPFISDTVPDTIVAVLTRDPDWRQLPLNTPVAARRLLHRTLERDPRRRLRDIGDARPDIDDAMAPDRKALTTSTSRGSSRLQWVGWGAATVAIALTTGWLAIRWQAAQPAFDEMSGTVIERLTTEAGLQVTPALSLDGHLLAYASDRAGHGDLDIWVQQPGGGGLFPVTSENADEYAPDFSPDGNQIAFRSEKDGGGVYLVPTLGGSPRLIVKDGRSPRFSPDGSQLAYWTGQWRGAVSSLPSAVFVQSLNGGAPQRFLRDFFVAREPVWAPDGRSLLVLGRRNDTAPLSETYDYWWVPLDGRPPARSGVLDLRDFRRAIDEAGLSWPVTGTWNASGLFVSLRGSIWSIPLSPVTGRVVGAPRRVTVGTSRYLGATVSHNDVVVAAIENPRVIERAPIDSSANPLPTVRVYSDHSPGASRPAQTSDGLTVVYTRDGSRFTELWARNVRSGQEHQLARVDTRGQGLSPAISPDGSRVVYTIGPEPEGAGYVMETSGGVPRPVCTGCVTYGFLSDNHRILAILDHGHGVGIVDTSNGAQSLVVQAPDHILSRAHPSPNDRWLAFRGIKGTVSKVYLVPLTSGRLALPEHWTQIDEPTTTGRPCGWSLDSQVLFMLLDTDGFRCLWGQRVDASGKPVGAPYAARHFHRTLTQEFSTSYGNAIGPEGFLYGGSAMTGDLWRFVIPGGTEK